ncbi:hypothetical protein [Aquipuribacter hungaricus]|uniref:Uncharacterized protein n=1 Tax=Aquipuribacter hungaricus TaxID=545624 RepID=A0ABV7WI57_9MICO
MVPRFVPTAVAAVGLVLLVVGLVMLTAARPPQQVTGTAEAAPVLVTAPGALALTGRPVQVDVEGQAFVGLGRGTEVAAWLDGVGATQVDGVATATTLATTDLPGDDPASVVPPADPALADVWQTEQSGEDVTVRLDAPAAEQVLAVVAPAGAAVTLTWDRPARHPGAWPLVVVGALEAVLGLLWLVALNARRRRRARRGRA